jgi:hypothetical protein
MISNNNKWAPLVGWFVSIGLLGAAFFTIWNRWGDLTSAIVSIEHPNLWGLLALPLIMLIAIWFVSESFRQLLNRSGMAKDGFAKIQRSEMFWLVLMAGMLNWLPLRAGLIGRTVYHSKVNGIPATKSLRVLLEVIVLTVCMSGVAFLLTGVSSVSNIQLVFLLVMPVFVLGLFSIKTDTRPWSVAIICRYFDVLLLAMRYWIIFGLIGFDITPETAILLAGAGTVSGLLPLPTGGLGGREWIIGFVASWVTVFPAAIALGLVADLINRVVELVVVLPLGLLGQRFIREKISHS